MPLLLFALTLAWAPWFAETGTAPRWLLASVFLPLLALPLRLLPFMQADAGLRLMQLWLGWAALTLLWTPSPWDGLLAWWKLCLLALAFIIGQSLRPRAWRRCMLALCLGLALNAPLLAAEMAGWLRMGGVDPHWKAATFANKNYLAEAAALAAIVCWRRGWWLLLPPLAFILVCTASKGAAVALLLAALWRLRQRSRTAARFAAGALAAIAATLMVIIGPARLAGETALHRLSLWHDTLLALQPFGHGLGSFWAIWPEIQRTAPPSIWAFGTGPDNPHMDALLLLSDLGAGALFPLLLFALAWHRGAPPREPGAHPKVPPDDARGLLLVFAGVGLFAFPLLNPLPAVLAAWLRVIACGLGLLFAVNLAAAELTWRAAMESGSRSQILAGLLAAEALFPLPARIREAAAITTAQLDDVPPVLALAVLSRALRHAPSDPRLIFWSGVQQLRAGDRVSAQGASARLRQLVPNWPQTHLLIRLIEETPS